MKHFCFYKTVTRSGKVIETCLEYKTKKVEYTDGSIAYWCKKHYPKSFQVVTAS